MSSSLKSKIRNLKPILDRRRAGVLLHPTSLPSGEIGADAYHFVDFLVASGVSVWQVLPLGPTHEDHSPYQCMSTHAGSEEFISISLLEEWGWLPALPDAPRTDRAASLRAAHAAFAQAPANVHGDYQLFQAAHGH